MIDLDMVMQLALIIVPVFCIYRLALAIFTYLDASGHGSDAMSWMALISVLGLLGLIIWIVVRPQGVPASSPPGQMPAQSGLTSRYNPLAVHRMLATFIAAMAFTVFIELPVLFLVFALHSPDVSDPQKALSGLLTPQLILFSIAVQDALLVYFMFIAIIKPGHLTLRNFGFSNGTNLSRWLPTGIGVGLVIFGLGSGLGYLIERAGWAAPDGGYFQAGGGLAGFGFIVMATVIIAPPAEELFFRVYALTSLEKRAGPPAGILLSAALFSAAHLDGTQFLPIFLIGILLGLSFKKWGIMPCIAAHAVNNLLAVTLIFAFP